ncbi:MAG: Ig-like domain-containing protein [Planctomycetia bacterium]|nr:Ig-like domain-containing protein [Planctomycetia bacterium]
MNFTSWLSGLNRRVTSRKRTSTRVNTPAVGVENMETRQLLSISALFIPDTGELNIQLDSDDNVRVGSSALGNVQLEVGSGTGAYASSNVLGTRPASDVKSIVILGGDNQNTIDLNGVTSVVFTNLVSIEVDGANGNDSIVGSLDIADSLSGGNGTDTLIGLGGNDTLLGGDGNDVIIGGLGDDSIRGGDGNDGITGDAGNDVIDSGNGDDTVSGGDGNDSVFAGNGQDSLTGNAGDDTLNGDGGTDSVSGGDGNDLIFGGEFGDLLLGDAGNDTISGQAGNDTIIGVTGQDKIDGGTGDDLIKSALDVPVDDAVPVAAQPAPSVLSPTQLPDAVNSTLGIDSTLKSVSIGTGTTDGGLTVQVTGTGSFGNGTSPTSTNPGAKYNPIDATGATTLIGAGNTVTTSDVYFRSSTISGARNTLETLATNRSTIVGTATEANSSFDVGTLRFELTQLAEPAYDLVTGKQIGSLLTQTYHVTNLGNTTSNFELSRALDGNMTFDGSASEGGGRVVSTAGDEFLVETDKGGTSASTNFVAITGKGGTVPKINRFEINQASTALINVQSGQMPNGKVFNDTNGDQSIDTDSDVALTLRNTFSLAPTTSTIYTTHTLFGTGTPNLVQVNQKPVTIADAGRVLAGRDIAIDVVSNDADADGQLDYASIQITQAPVHGTVVVLQDGRVRYTPDAGYSGNDAFYYTIADNLGARSNPTLVSVEVSAIDILGDAINGGIGNDTVIGGDGNDTILGGSGQDSLFGGLGNDRIQGQGGEDSINGGGGADTLDGGDGNDFVQSASIQIAINDVAVTEGNTGTTDAVFTVGLSAASSSTITVDYSTLGVTATSGSDFLPASGTLTFAPGVTTQTITVQVNGDTTSESNETFSVKLTNATEAVLFNTQGQGTITDDDRPVSLALTPGANVNASRLAGSQAEVHIAVNPTNPQNVVAVANGGTADPSAQFIANSTDGGTTWTIRPLSFGQDTIGTAANSDRFDAAVAFDRFGNLHLTYMARTSTAGDAAIMYAISSDGGTTFTTRILAPLSATVDKPWIATGPDAANAANEAVYVTYRDTAGLVVQGAVATGLGTVGAFSAASLFSANGNYAVPSVGPNGELAITWLNPAGGQGPGVCQFDRDLNGLVGGLTFGVDTSISSTNFGGFDFIPATPDRSTFASPYVAYDLSNGPHRGRLYAAYADEIIDESNNSDIELRFSDDNGGTWSTPVRVNDDTGTNSQFFQNISVDRTNGNVFLSWYDARNDVGASGINSDGIDNTDVQVFMAGSLDGGLTFGPNVLVSTGASNQARDVTDPGNDFGDYAGLAAYNDTVYVIWTDNSNSTGDNPGGRATFDVYTSRVTVGFNTSTGGGSSTALPTIIDDGDVLNGGAGNDTLVGSTGNDTLNGQGDNDSLLGGDGNDSLLGGSGQDTLDGQAGNDTLNGQGGNDTLLGGNDNDIIVLDSNGSGADSADGQDGFNTIVVNGTNKVDTINVSQIGSVLMINNGSGTIGATQNIQSVVINTLAGNDTVTLGNLNGVVAMQLTVNGGDGNDLLDATGAVIGTVRLALNGNDGNDSLNGSLGNDSLNGGAGNDVIAGNAGNDVIQGGDGNDLIGGGLGDDVISGGDGADVINGQQGNDNLNGGNGNDTLKGDVGNDTLSGAAGDDNLNGMDGDDSILGGVGQDAISGGIGNDTLDGGRNDDSINGNAGDDLIRGDHGNDYIDAGEGNNTVNGGDGDDTILTESGNDFVHGGDGNDRINVGDGNDIVVGGDGNDTVLGGAGNDTILGGDGDDSLDGQGGADTIAGQQGNDTIIDPVAEIREKFVLPANIFKILTGL